MSVVSAKVCTPFFPAVEYAQLCEILVRRSHAGEYPNPLDTVNIAERDKPERHLLSRPFDSVTAVVGARTRGQHHLQVAVVSPAVW